MGIKIVVSGLTLIGMTILFLMGFCSWDLPIYIATIIIIAGVLLISLRQENKLEQLQTKQPNRL